MSSYPASSLFTAPPTTFFAVLCTTFSILFGPARKLYLQLLVVLHLAIAPFFIIQTLIQADLWKNPGGGEGAMVVSMLLWLCFAVLIAPFLYTYLFGDMIYGVGKEYAGEVQPTRDSKWMSKKSWSEVGIVFLYALIVIGICTGAPYCIAYLFETVDDISRWGRTYYHQYNISQTIFIMILNALGFIFLIPFAGSLLVAFVALLHEDNVSWKRLYNLCGKNFCFIYTKLLGYILCVLLLLALTFQVTDAISHAGTFLSGILEYSVVVSMSVYIIVCVYWWNFILMFPTITTILPIVLYMSIRVRNEELTQETFADDIGLSRSDDGTSPLIPQGDDRTEETDANDDTSHINESGQL